MWYGRLLPTFCRNLLKMEAAGSSIGISLPNCTYNIKEDHAS
jgi:hypothetical protein